MYHNTLRRYATSYRNKITNKLFGVVSAAHRGKKRGAVLLSLITGPFTLAPKEYFSDPHSNYWVAPEIARLFSERGYDIDIINWDNRHFIPRKKYAACVDMQYNLERLSPLLGPQCVKIMHLMASHPKFQNEAEQARIHALQKRKGVLLAANRTVPFSSDPRCADFIEGYGNKTVHDTYRAFGKKIISIPIPAMEMYDFPQRKNFAVAQKNFLWFGGGGAVLKGLDLCLETFASLPHLNLIIIGPASYEKEFESLYAQELKLPNITRYGRPRINEENEESRVGDTYLHEIMEQCGAIISLSASEGTSGSVVQAMHAGLFPIITSQTGIDERAPSMVIENPTLENIRKAVLDFSNLPVEKVAELARESWSFARQHYTKESFTKAYSDFIDTVLQLPA